MTYEMFAGVVVGFCVTTVSMWVFGWIYSQRPLRGRTP